MEKIVKILLLTCCFPVYADWTTSKIDRIQVMPTGNISFWLSTKPTGCGTPSQPFKVEQNFFAVNIEGVKIMNSMLITALTIDSSLDISVRDVACRVDSVTLNR